MTRHTAIRSFIVLGAMLAIGLTCRTAHSQVRYPNDLPLPVGGSAVQQVIALEPAASRGQVMLYVRMIRIDDETRAKLYEELGTESVRTRRSETVRADGPETIFQSGHASSSRQELASDSFVSTAILDDQSSRDLFHLIESDAQSNVMFAPKVAVFSGMPAMIKDTVQRPFVVNVVPVVDEHSDAQAFQPVVEVIEEGTEIEVQATVNEDDQISVKCGIRLSAIADVREENLLGFDEPVTVQIPIRQITQAIASESIASGDSILVDPYLMQVGHERRETGVPIVSSVPYVSRLFKNVSLASYNQWTLIHVQAVRIEDE